MRSVGRLACVALVGVASLVPAGIVGADGLDPSRPGSVGSKGSTPSATAPPTPTFATTNSSVVGASVPTTTPSGATAPTGLTIPTAVDPDAGALGTTSIVTDGSTAVEDTTTSVAGEDDGETTIDTEYVPGDAGEEPSDGEVTDTIQGGSADPAEPQNASKSDSAQFLPPSLLALGVAVVVAVGLGVMGIFSRKRVAASVRRPIEPELIEQLYAANAPAADPIVDEAPAVDADAAPQAVDEATAYVDEPSVQDAADEPSVQDVADEPPVDIGADDEVASQKESDSIDQAVETADDEIVDASVMTAGALLAAVTGQPEEHVPSLATAEEQQSSEVSFLNVQDDVIAGSSGDQSGFGAFLAEQEAQRDPNAPLPKLAPVQRTIPVVPPVQAAVAATASSTPMADGRGTEHLDNLRKQVTRTELSAQESFSEASKLRVEAARLAAQAEWSAVREADAKREAIRRAGKDSRTAERALSEVAKYRREAAQLQSQASWADERAVEARKLGLRLLDDAKRLRDQLAQIAGSQSIRSGR